MNKIIFLIIIVVLIIGLCTILILSIRDSTVNPLEIGTFAVLTLTLIALVIYARDTNLLAKITQAKWQKETLLSTTYEMVVQNDGSGPGRVAFRLNNPSTLIVRAKVWAVFRIYGDQVDAGAPYNGTDTWVLFPNQISQGWYSIQNLLAQKDKTIAQIQAETSDDNLTTQFTLDLTIEFRDELGNSRKLPTRNYYFLFREWRWIPILTERNDDLWES